MAQFDGIIAELVEKFGLGDAAVPLLHEAGGLIAATSGGLSGFLNRFREAGFGAITATWLGRANGKTLTGPEVEEVLGAVPVTDIAGRTGLTREATGAALGTLIPRLVGELTPGGEIGLGVPAVLRTYLGLRGPVLGAAAASARVAP